MNYCGVLEPHNARRNRLDLIDLSKNIFVLNMGPHCLFNTYDSQ